MGMPLDRPNLDFIPKRKEPEPPAEELHDHPCQLSKRAQHKLRTHAAKLERMSQPRALSPATPRQLRRLRWLAARTQVCRVGTETYSEDGVLLITRVKRKPPTWMVDVYRETAKVDQPDEFSVLLMKVDVAAYPKAAMSPVPRWSVVGDGIRGVFADRNLALEAIRNVQVVADGTIREWREENSRLCGNDFPEWVWRGVGGEDTLPRLRPGLLDVSRDKEPRARVQGPLDVWGLEFRGGGAFPDGGTDEQVRDER